jgi:iron complex transport system ATP-binding protein
MTLLDASNVSFAYGDRAVLRDVSIQLATGQIVSLLGPNGSGKSTLLRVLLGTLRPAGGSIAWNARELRTWPRRDLAKLVAYLPQSPLADDEETVLDVLRKGRAPYWGAFGIESEQDLRVISQVAGQLGLGDLLRRPMAELSGGQRQRVFIGRCLAQEPKALLLDEPNTFLDLRHQVELGQLLRSLARDRGMGILMASHDINLAAATSDRLVLLQDGVVVATGASADVLEPELISKVYGVPMRRVNEPSHAIPVLVPAITSGP